jgi:methenyltetrahydromethanopterin cyclohydrolase
MVPSSSSRDHGEPFAAIFARYNNDFYAVDPHLFSPAEVVFHNLDTGRVHPFGRLEPAVLTRSFSG